MPDLRCVVPLLLASLVGAGGVRAQVPPGATPAERALLARADSLWAGVQARIERERQAERERSRAQLLEAGGLAVVVPSTVAGDRALKSLDTAGVLLREFGGIPDAYLHSVVAVFEAATDTGLALAAPVVRARRRVPIGGVQLTEVRGGGSTLNLTGHLVAGAVAWAYKDTRDADWRSWLPGDYGLGGWTRSAAWAAFESLTRSPWGVGARCVAGDAWNCRLWLGVDRDSIPYRSRYDATEIRAYLNHYVEWLAHGSGAGRDCLSGNGEACYLYVSEGRNVVLSPFPADETGRRSLVRAVRALHGADVLQRAFADTSGSVGERFARAAGIGEDSLVLEWRYWVLTRGGRPQDRNLLADAAPAVLLAGLLLAAARRSRG